MYSLSQEIDVLAFSLPYMEAAKNAAKSLGMNDHGPLHAQRVYMNTKLLCSIFQLDPYEEALLLASALLHDIGMVKNRTEHHIEAEQIVLEASRDGALPFSIAEGEIVGRLCRWHRKAYDPENCYELEGRTIRVGLLASLLRFADSMDLDYRRSPDYEKGKALIQEEQKEHHLSVLNIAALRIIVSNSGKKVEVLLEDFEHARLQIGRLIDELLGVNFYWPVQIVPAYPNVQQPNVAECRKKAVVFAYCNAHGLVSATISKRQLELQGFIVEIICDFEQTARIDIFWKNVFKSYDFSQVDLISMIDLQLPNEFVEEVLERIRNHSDKRWYYASPLTMSCLEIEELTEAGVTFLLCDERALFVGSSVSHTDLFWMKVAGICNFDNPYLKDGLCKEEYAVSMGLRYAMALASEQSSAYSYEDIVDRIYNNDRIFFQNEMQKYRKIVRQKILQSEQYGKVLLVAPCDLYGRFVYDYLWAEIEKYGLKDYEDREYEVPYAIYIQRKKDGLRFLYTSRFHNQENAYPVKYFIDTSVSFLGSNSTIWQNFSSVEDGVENIAKVVGRINAHFKEEHVRPVTMEDILTLIDQ